MIATDNHKGGRNRSISPESAYIHIPFCSHKCEFCDFAAFAGLMYLEDDYCQVLKSEISGRLANSPRLTLNTVFYGGGTPGLIKPENIADIHQHLLQFVDLAIDQPLEIAMETTPHAITRDKTLAWTDIGINRLSIGLESLQDSELKAIGRDHSQAQAVEGLRIAAEVFDNISIDFMYGLPTQTVGSWKNTLKKAVLLAQELPQIKHISAYGLEIAINSPLLVRFPRDSASYPNEDSCVEMYEVLIKTLAEAGFMQYEVSNFARPGYASQHNLAYWKNAQYLAFGVGAHRYVDGVRSSNLRSLMRYMREPLTDEFSEDITAEIRLKEGIMLGLRLISGIDLQSFEQDYGVDLLTLKKTAIESLLAEQLLQLSDGRLSITAKGIPISNAIISSLI
jgi:oxygen-independent coproporphyrinogen III oxidase